MPRRLSRLRPAARAALALGATLAAMAAGAAPSSASTTAAPPCATSRLVIWLDTQGNGAAGSTYYRLELTNLSRSACTLFGYPRVSAVDLAAHRLGSAATRDAAHAARKVRLAPGASATAVLRIVDAANFPRRVCRPTTAAGVRVSLPHASGSKLVPFPFRACSRTRPGPVFLTVQAVARG